MKERFTASIAKAYGEYSQKYTSILEPNLIPMAQEMIHMSSLKGDELVLDLATGTGLIARSMAGSVATVTGIDISPGMLTNARSLSADKIPFVVGDAHELPFGDQCFDLVICGLSLSHFSQVSAALGEILRVLRPQGCFITSAWGSGGKNPSKTAAVEVRRRYLEDRQITFEGKFHEDVWEDTSQGCESLKQAGFVDVVVKTRLLSGEYRSPVEALEVSLAWPLTRYRIARLARADRRRLIEETAAAINEIDDLRWQSEIHYYRARRPERSKQSV